MHINCTRKFIFMLIGILTLCILPNFTFITKFYYFTPITGSSGPLNADATSNLFTVFTLFTMTLLIRFIILLSILTYLIVDYGLLDLKSVLLIFILNAVVGFGFFAIGFIGLLNLGLFFSLYYQFQVLQMYLHIWEGFVIEKL